ncbi:MAG: hypothetical protein KGN00_09585 [Chloroflexota bacterium]|nr:hypothetical protein [Chloroflexota bacterium]
MHLAVYERCQTRLRQQWSTFLQRRDRLQQQERHGVAAERVTENIQEDLFTVALDWQLYASCRLAGRMRSGTRER